MDARAQLYDITRAAEAAGAWVVTGGTDSGVMRTLGRMASAVSVETGSRRQSCWVGVVPWGGVRSRKKIVDKREQHETMRGKKQAEVKDLKKQKSLGVVSRKAKGVEPVQPKQSLAKDPPSPNRQMSTSSEPPGSPDPHSPDRDRAPRVSSAGAPLPEIEVNFDVKATKDEEEALDDEEADLEPNHTHFLLVDNGLVGKNVWGDEIPLRFAIERVYCQTRGVPRVMLVVQGGEGTLRSIRFAVHDHCPVVLIEDSGGVASLLTHFIKTCTRAGSCARCVRTPSPCSHAHRACTHAVCTHTLPAHA
jgi:hypothetical protein